MPISSLQDCIYNLLKNLSRLAEWCSSWNLFLNEVKCSAFHFKSRLSQTSFNYSINSKQISSKAVGEDLGLSISANFTWQLHYHSISSKAYKLLGLLRRVFSSSMSVSAKWSLFFVQAFSTYLQYGTHTSSWISSVWNLYRRDLLNLFPITLP